MWALKNWLKLISRVTIENRDKMSLLVELFVLFCPKNIKVKNLKKHTRSRKSRYLIIINNICINTPWDVFLFS